jgi:hypothetical protein
MAIVMAGKQFTADQLQQTAGDLASLMRDTLERSDNFRIQLESFVDADLVTLGLTQDEVNAIKGYYIGDVPGIRAPFVASAWVKQLLGTGV